MDDLRRRSHWMLRVLEWNDPKARYPNLWQDGMPAEVLVYDTIATRLRIGDLIAIYYPQSARHPKRSERYIGLSRVAALRPSHLESQYWLDLEAAHRFAEPLDLGAAPRRVFLCCNTGWPEQDVAVFHRVFERAVEQGFKPRPEELPSETAAPEAVPVAPAPADKSPTAATVSEQAPPAEAPVAADSKTAPAAAPPPVADTAKPGPLFGGIGLSGDRRDPRDGTWLAMVRLEDNHLRVVRLDPTGRHGLQQCLRNPDRKLMQVEAIGCGFPFGIPVPFAEALFGEKYPEEGWWGLARKFEHLPYPEYLVKLQEFRDSHGDVRRFVDERAGGPSPLQRGEPDLGLMTYHGIRLIAEERSRYAVRPFESAQGHLLLEVDPGALLRATAPDAADGADAGRAALQAVHRADTLPVIVDEPFLARCRASEEALNAVLAARATAVAVQAGETERTADELAPEQSDRVQREGWIYGI